NATTASWLRATACPTTGNSTAPPTRTTDGSLTPHSSAILWAPASNASHICLCHVLTTIASVSAEASCDAMSGTPAPLIRAGPGSQGTTEFAWQMDGFVIVVQPDQVMTHPVTLGHQIPDVLRIGAHRQRHPLDDMQPVAVQADSLGGVVGQQPHRADPEVDQDLGPGAVVACVGGQSELEVGVDGVVAGVLQLIGLQLVHQADAATFMATHVEHHAAAFARDHRHRGVQLRAAVAAS